MITATTEQLAAAFVAWDKLAANEPELFEEMDAEMGNNATKVAEFFVTLLTEQGATLKADPAPQPGVVLHPFID